MKRFFILLFTTIVLWSIFAVPIHGASDRPVIVIKSIETEPFPVVSGNEFKLKVNLKNEGSQSARWVTLHLASVEGSEGLGQFSLIKDDNTIYFGRMDKEKDAEGSFSMITGGEIKPGIYNLNFVVRYTNNRGVEYETNHVTGIMVTEEEAISLFNIRVPSEAELDNEIEIEGEFANLGKHDIENVMIRIFGDVEITPSEYFVGTMAAGDMDAFSSKAIINEPGDINIKIEASYTDSMNQKKGTAIEKKVQVPEPQKEATDVTAKDIQDEDGFWNSIGTFLKRLFGLG